MRYEMHDLIGLLGVVLILIAYGLLQAGRWKSDEIRYSVLNVLGGCGILFSLFYEWNLSAAIMEIAWIILSLYGIWQTWRKRT